MKCSHPYEVMGPAVEAATRRAWASRTVIIAEPVGYGAITSWRLDHLEDLTDHLVAHAAGELLLVPRRRTRADGSADRRSATAARTAGPLDRRREPGGPRRRHDLGRALLSTRAHELSSSSSMSCSGLGEYRRQLIATVAHELKNPLGVIVGHVEMLEAVPGLPKAAGTSLGALGRGASRLISVVDDLLLLSRMQLGQPGRGAAGRPRAVLTEVTEDESLLASQQGVTLRIAHGGVLTVAEEPEELRRVLANLVSNAVKYSRTEDTVDLSVQRREEVVFTCADEGLGISEEDRTQLFTEVFRSTNLEALQRPGTGLGLASSTGSWPVTRAGSTSRPSSEWARRSG